MIDVSLVIPFYNEELNLADLIYRLNDYAKVQDFTMEAVLVDDGSTDLSIRVLRECASVVPIKLVRLSKNYGSHAALRAGLTQAKGDYAMFFSADMQEPFSIIGDMYAKVCEGYDIVIARKSSADVPYITRLFSRIYTRLIQRIAMRDYPDKGANNFLLCRKVINVICENPEANSSIFIQIISLGFNRAVIDVSWKKRHAGKSKWTFSKKVKLFIDSIVAFSYTPIRAISVIGIVVFIAGLLYALWIVIARLTGIFEFETGFPTLISVLLMGFGLTNFSLGIIAEYVWRTLDTARNRPVFIIDSVEDLSGGRTE